MKNLIKKILYKNDKLKIIAKDIQKNMFLDTNISEITPIESRKIIVDKNFKRLNLIVPSINQEHLFGGISTAILVFEKIANKLNFKKRIILTDAEPSKYDLLNFSQYNHIDYSIDSLEDNQIVVFNDRYKKTIPVSVSDYFMSTSWWTDYILNKILFWQKDEYSLEKMNKSLYIIQDYEPGFYEWSTRYMLARSTYSPINYKIGIFNTKILYDFFKKQGHSLSEEYVYEPTMNNNLKKYLNDNKKGCIKEKIVLIYGRPSVKRNCFELIVESLKLVSWKINDIKEWKFISLGEKHPNIDLGNGAMLESYGKVSLEEYANFMMKTYLGISLMASPHPSYPPLEMASFGIKVITNSFENKNLSNFDSNILSLEKVDIQCLGEKIIDFIEDFYSNEISLNKNVFLESINNLDFIKSINF